MKYIPPNIKGDDERKSSTTLRSTKRRLGARANEDNDVKFPGTVLPTEEIIAGKTPEPPAPESDASTSLDSATNESDLRIDYEVLPFNDIEGISQLLDGVKISSPSETPTIPPIKPNQPSRPSCENPFLSDLDIPNEIAKLLHTSNDLSTPIFRFDISPEAAQHNWKLIKDSNFNLTRLLNPKSPCITNFGSEFKSVRKLANLFRNHPR